MHSHPYFGFFFSNISDRPKDIVIEYVNILDKGHIQTFLNRQ